MKASTTPFVITSANSIINGPYPITALQFTPPLDLSSLSPCVQENIVVFLSGLPWTFNSSSLRDVQSHPDGYLLAMTNAHAHCSHGLLTKYSSREPAFEMSSLSAQRVNILFLLCFSLPCLITVTCAWKKMCAFFFLPLRLWICMRRHDGCMCVFSQVYVSMHASVHRSSERYVALDLISCSRLGVYKAEGTMTVCD